jgi:hypothetical protein
MNTTTAATIHQPQPQHPTTTAATATATATSTIISEQQHPTPRGAPLMRATNKIQNTSITK